MGLIHTFVVHALQAVVENFADMTEKLLTGMLKHNQTKMKSSRDDMGPWMDPSLAWDYRLCFKPKSF